GDTPLGSQTNFFNVDTYFMSREELTAALAKVAPQMQRLHQALAKPCLLPVDYAGATPLVDAYFGGIHCLKQALSAEGRLAELDGAVDRCLAVNFDQIELGYACRRGGLLDHAQAGATATGAGVWAIDRLRLRLNKEQCLSAVARLAEFESRAEP